MAVRGLCTVMSRVKVPETMHFRLEGKLQPGVMAKDIILHCIGEIGFDLVADPARHRALGAQAGAADADIAAKIGIGIGPGGRDRAL